MDMTDARRCAADGGDSGTECTSVLPPCTALGGDSTLVTAASGLCDAYSLTPGGWPAAKLGKM